MGLRVIAALSAVLMLTSCVLTPGQFTSELSIDKSGQFTFSYQGEISVLGFNQLIDMAAHENAEGFAGECYNDEFEERPCTEEEKEEQRAAKAAENARDAEMFKTLLGGIDPSKPEAIDDFIERVSRQKGWNSISHKGKGVFDVDFRISGNADQGFTFPMIEKLQAASPFVTIIARKDNKVRVEAPGFAGSEQGPGMGTFGALAAMGAGESGKGGTPAPAVLPNGTFTVRTSGTILTNNTEEGPTRENGEQVLRWEITPATTQPPETLIALD
ncbi:hypothetical protein [Alterisphingorhabdus coralli]|uniref:Lipoprotein n=1 Tax=Alterisphingorhabdus coralli TaxID=3071408 RepID=A0AA97F987_9SPHN|nr:hypothetical protein [Parasphingorhabdus sp. SCSIO 66989]WOE76303.1 hypothetical protein RB602_06215 [Parasphingorhabdus sp. SCSIO 66989]